MKWFKKKEKKEQVPAVPKMDLNKYHLRLNVRAICYYEHFTGKNFFKMKENDFIYLLYSMFVTSTDFKVTYKEFEIMLSNERIAKWVANEYLSETKACTMTLTGMEAVNEGEESTEEESMTSLVSTLIIRYGLNPDYVYDRMQIWEIPNYFLAANAEMKDDMVTRRLFTYMIDVPHMDPKKGPKSPEDFMPFPWEKESKKEKRIKDINKNRDAILRVFQKKEKKENNE